MGSSDGTFHVGLVLGFEFPRRCILLLRLPWYSHLATAAFAAIARRRSGDSFSARTRPPFLARSNRSLPDRLAMRAFPPILPALLFRSKAVSPFFRPCFGIWCLV